MASPVDHTKPAPNVEATISIRVGFSITAPEAGLDVDDLNGNKSATVYVPSSSETIWREKWLPPIEDAATILLDEAVGGDWLWKYQH